jgi:serine/threonine-protein kinase PpkA
MGFRMNISLLRRASFCFSAFLAADIATACTSEQATRHRGLQNQHAEVFATLERALSRLRGQDRRLAAIDSQQAIEDGPAPPAVATPSFGERSRIDLNCDDADGAEATLSAAEDELTELAAAVDDFEAAVDAREARVAEIEDAATQPPADGAGSGLAGAQPAPDGGNRGDAAAPGAQPAPPASDQPSAREPLKVEDNALVYQRLLTLPDARILSAPGANPEEGEDAFAFSVLYVYGRQDRDGATWVEVGPGVAGDPVGWIRADQTLAWNSALVMQFAPVGRRERVLFFREVGDLVDVIRDFQFAAEARGFYDRLAGGTLEDQRFIAAEPATAVSYADEPYLLPILDHVEEVFDDATEVTLVKVASVSLETSTLSDSDPSSLAPAEDPAQDLRDFDIGVVFVIDSTASMGPYIEHTYDAVRTIYASFEDVAQEVQATFGLVAYRDNFAHDARVGYVTEIVQPLDPDANPRTILANIGSVRPSPAPTVDWREDAYAGVAKAIETFDWSPFDARIVILITDAGAREGGDSLASRSDLTTGVLTEDARAKGVAIVPIHLITPEAERENDVERAARQYQILSDGTGTPDARKYIAVDARSSAAFEQEIRQAADALVREVRALAQANAAPTTNDGAIKSGDGPPVQGTDGGVESGPEGRLAGALATEILRAKLEFLGARDDATAPGFVSGWAANRDLTDPARETLSFSIFLTRNQISALAQSVEQLIDAFRSAGASPGAFFDQLQLIAAKTARDPDLVRQDERAAVREILPSFIQGLPYLSEVLRLDRDLWEQFSTADRENFVEGLEEKLRIYERLYEQTENWVDFGAGDPALEAYAMPLAQLP